jgi:hypothetical protein
VLYNHMPSQQIRVYELQPTSRCRTLDGPVANPMALVFVLNQSLARSEPFVAAVGVAHEWPVSRVDVLHMSRERGPGFESFATRVAHMGPEVDVRPLMALKSGPILVLVVTSTVIALI